MHIPLGDVYVLMEKFGKKSRKEELTKLVDSVRRRKPDKGMRQKPSKIQVTFKWFNFDKKKSKYTMVRAENGGGVRQKSMNRNADYSAVAESAKGMFFPNNVNGKDEILSHFFWKLGSPQLEEINETFADETGETKSFTIDEYSNLKSWKKIIFVLLTKKKSSQQFVLSQKIDVDSDSDFESTPRYKKVKAGSINSTNSTTFASNTLPGGSIRLEQDLEFFRSLQSDQEKEKVI